MLASHDLDSLNPAQREAVRYGEMKSGGGVTAGPLLVIAGAGTGKTSTLAHRVAHLLLAGVPAERVLLLTFTRRAALEMTRRAQQAVASTVARGRTGRALPTALRLPWSGTFHAIGNRLIRLHAERLGLDPGFNVLDRTDAADLMDVVRQRLGLSKTEKRFPRKDTCLAIYSHRVNAQLPLRRTLELLFPWCLEWEDALTALCREYVDAKLAQQLLDYDDLLLYWQLMMAEPDIAAGIGARFDHVLVDEYQDTNRLQAGILAALRPDGAGVTVVGDDAQAIYSFRAATVENIREFPHRFDPHARIVTLEQNYRSTQPVLDAANALMAEAGPQYRKDLRSACGAGPRPAYVVVQDDQAQAGYVIEQVLDRARARRGPAAPGGALSRGRSQRPARAGAHAAQHPVRQVRRPQVSRGGARQGPACGAAPGRQSAQPDRGVSRAAAAAGHGAGELGARLRCLRVRRTPFRRAVAAAGADRRSRGLVGPERAARRDRRNRDALGWADHAGAELV